MDQNRLSPPNCRNFNCNNKVGVREYGEEGMPIFETLCPECLAAWDRMLANAVTKPPVAETPLPELYKDTDPERLGDLAKTAKHWRPNRASTDMHKGKGLLIHGSTRKGKTRTAWYIADRFWNENKYANKYLFLTMFELEARLVAAWGKDAWDKAMYKMVNVPMLFLDDLGKEKMTDRMASCLFALVDQRAQHMRPTVITTNLTGDTLMDRFHDKELGAAFVARLKDPDLFDRVAAK
jgi:DNA replication protein DnaC